ncbi:MFS transporter [Cupriavidus pinatubonensis]|uniref:Enterobactin exporter EntS n=1 Tax=Cupriavidus pinatubonensis TaxID=248026 RepID=A0ABM8WF67_9BURK|nr:MFS transporter [Cupriavidus pinatubonensis]CAG9165976.1 Enterobactin exporter EntS [Cupriavidus pinatubonensis]
MPPTPPTSSSVLQPLREPVFRMLWLAWLAGNMTMWMNDVSASWLMAQLTEGPMMVALVQACASLPLFLLGLPSGALADLLDRKRLYAFAQFWIAVVSTAMAVLVALGGMTAPWLLVLSLANGVGLAMRFPVFSAIVPTLVPRTQLPAALTLNALAINVSRIAGPLLAGVVIASLGMGAVFTLNAALSLLSCVLILNCRAPAHQPAVRRQGLMATMRGGLAFVAQSPPMRNVLLRAFLFFVHANGLLALLPLVAKGHQANATTYTMLLASMGAGAIASAIALPRVSDAGSRDRVVAVGIVLYALAVCAAALAPSLWLVAPALALSGGVWLCVVNTLTMSAQLVLPNGVRARGIAIYQMAIMGGSAAGAALWGQVASQTSVQAALIASAASSVAVQWLSRRVSVDAEALPEHDVATATAATTEAAEAG